MAAKLILVLACIALSQAGLVRRDASTPTALEDLQKNAADFQKTITEQFQSIVNSKNAQDVNKAIKEGSDDILKQLSALSSSFQSALSDANGKANEALQQTRQSIERASEELRRSHPDVEQNASALRDKFQAAFQTVAQETQKLAKEVATGADAANQKLAPKLKEAFDTFVAQAEVVRQKVHDAATKQ